MSPPDPGNSDDPQPTPPAGELPLVGPEEFRTATGEPIQRVLDLDTWYPGEDLAALYGRLEQVVAEAVRQEDRVRAAVRARIFPRLRALAGTATVPSTAGVYQATVADIERVHRGLLLNGAVEACDGTSAVHDTLPVTIAQIGVCLVSYQGEQGAWVNRLFRRDLWVGGVDPVAEAMAVLDRRGDRAAFDMASHRDTLSDLGRRGIMAYAERAVLLERSDAPWRMGHGNPTPYELLTGSGMVELLESSLDLLHRLVVEHRRFVFVPSAPRARTLLTIGNALRPLEFAILDTLTDWLDRIVDTGGYRGGWAAVLPRLRDFVREVGPQVVVGTYRASAVAPPQLFYAHRDHAHEAALIALADSTFHEHRGFPMLIDLADLVCRGTFDGGSFNAQTQLAYLEAGEPYRYLTERQTRK